LLSACATGQDDGASKTTESGMKVRTTIENSWNLEAQAIADKVYNDAWEFHELKAGKAVVVRLYRNDFLIGTFDGASYREIVFQIPPDVKSGQKISLRTIPAGRPAKKVGKYDHLAPMKDGEVTAFRFGNPSMGWMKKSEIAKVKIVSIDDTEAVIHLRLKADLEEHWDFDIDEQFTLKVTSPARRENKSVRTTPDPP
jgi:hypothetical protein